MSELLIIVLLSVVIAVATFGVWRAVSRARGPLGRTSHRRSDTSGAMTQSELLQRKASTPLHRRARRLLGREPNEFERAVIRLAEGIGRWWVARGAGPAGAVISPDAAAATEVACASCGSRLGPSAAWCGACGTPVARR